MVSFKDSIIVFGGYIYVDYPGWPITLSTVAKFEKEEWTQLGNMNEKRYGHNCIIDGSDILIIGGLGSKQTEVWNSKQQQSTSINPILSDYKTYPFLFQVQFDFCSTN